MTPEQLGRLLEEPEGERLEFKEWKTHGDFEKLCKYASALANEGGGYFILGVTDRRPRRVVGTTAFDRPEEVRKSPHDRLRLDIGAFEFPVDGHRVLAFVVPPRQRGVPVLCNGVGYFRQSDSLLPLSADKLRVIFDEIGIDHSAELCGASLGLESIDQQAVEEFRKRWHAKSRNDALLKIPAQQLLEDAELVQDGRLTVAALVLLGTPKSLTRVLGAAEIIFEYRNADIDRDAAVRQEIRKGFFLYYEQLWETLHLRNSTQAFQDGLFRLDIRTFDEISVREVLLNAVAHRDYRLPASIFIKQFPRKLGVVSPGGFLPGITPANVLGKSAPRNRRIAETFQKCGLVERAGQGLDRVFEHAITHGKPQPDFSGTDDFQVCITLDGTMTHPDFVQFYQKVAAEKQIPFTLADLRALAAIYGDLELSPELRLRLPLLLETGLVERHGRGKGVKLILARSFYEMTRQSGRYTKRVGLDHETHKELLMKHLRNCDTTGAAFSTLQQVVPHLTRAHLQALLRELREEGKARMSGERRGARWHRA
jgi:ATP-dependent DNA helicase RecG